jgi:hypothetical protein
MKKCSIPAVNVQVLGHCRYHVNSTFAMQAASKLDAYAESYSKRIAEAGCGGHCGGTGVFGFSRMWRGFCHFFDESNSFRLL